MRIIQTILSCLCLSLVSGESIRAASWSECECPDTTFTPMPSSGSYKVVNVWARDSAGTESTATWAGDLWNTSEQFNLTAYWSQVTYGNLQFSSVDVFDAEDPTKYIVIDTTIRIDTNIAPPSGQPIGLRADAPWNDRSTNDPKMWLFYRRIMAQVDQQIDFADFDSDLDGYVDYLNFFISAEGASGGYNASRAWPWLPDSLNTDREYVSSDVNQLGDTVVVHGQYGSTYYNIDNHGQKALFGVVAHEMGHYGPRFGWHIPDRYTYDFPALGSYDLFTTYSFNREWPSPVLPWDVAYRLRMDDIDTVETSVFGLTIEDRLARAGNVVGVVPTGVPSKQLFLMSLHMRQSPWELSWPSYGVIITHVTDLGTHNGVTFKPRNRYWREQKLEWAHGLYLWDTIATPDTLPPYDSNARYAIIDSTKRVLSTSLRHLHFEFSVVKPVSVLPG